MLIKQLVTTPVSPLGLVMMRVMVLYGSAVGKGLMVGWGEGAGVGASVGVSLGIPVGWEVGAELGMREIVGAREGAGEMDGA